MRRELPRCCRWLSGQAVIWLIYLSRCIIVIYLVGSVAALDIIAPTVLINQQTKWVDFIDVKNNLIKIEVTHSAELLIIVAPNRVRPELD